MIVGFSPRQTPFVAPARKLAVLCHKGHPVDLVLPYSNFSATSFPRHLLIDFLAELIETLVDGLVNVGLVAPEEADALIQEVSEGVAPLIPTLSPWGVVALIFILLLSVVFLRRRQEKGRMSS